MLDVHPEPEHARIQVEIGGETSEVGNLDDTAYIRDIHAGRAVIASLIRDRFFARDREVTFEHIFHATDVDTWLAFREERSSRSIVDPNIVLRVRELLSEPGGEIRVVNRGHACLLTKTEVRTVGER